MLVAAHCRNRAIESTLSSSRVAWINGGCDW
jgi:hypothetical protein